MARRKKTDEQEQYLKQFNNGIIKLLAFGVKYRTKEFMAVIIMILLTIIIVIKKEDIKQWPGFNKIFKQEVKQNG